MMQLASLPNNVQCVWSPQPGPQTEAILATWCKELLYGGAVGGGKSDYLLGDFLQDVYEYAENWHGLLLRRTMGELEEIIARSHTLFPQTGASYSVQKSKWTWDNGATLRLRYIERKEDLSRYQGHQYGWIGFDELTHWNDPLFFTYFRSRLRCAHRNLPTKRMRATANPGGAGHNWVKNMFIDHAPMGYVPIRDEVTGDLRMFIPSRVQDNKILMMNDPGYVSRLKGTGSPELVRALLEGDWNVVEGAYFSTFSVNSHVIAPFAIPQEWTRLRGFDWGSAKPFACVWGAVSDGSIENIPKNAVVIYRELYGCEPKIPNKGIKLPSNEVASRILRAEGYGEKINISVADPAIFHRTDGESIAEKMYKCGVWFSKADNDRLAGWDQIHSRLADGEDGKPLLYFFSNCNNIIRTLPSLQHDTSKPEDLDSDGEDHLADALRYLLIARPHITKPKTEKKKALFQSLSDMTFKELAEWKPRRKRRKM